MSWKAAHCVEGLATVALLLISMSARGQTAPPPPPLPTAEDNGETVRWGVPPSAPLDPPPPEGVGTTPAPDLSFLQRARFDYTWLAGDGDKGLRINDLDASVTLAVPVVDGWAPLLLTPDLAAHSWEGPNARGVPDLPSNLYDLSLEIGWRPQLARWLFADVAVTPGVYTDFKDVASDSFQMRGRGLGIVALSPQLQFVAGGMYVNRNKTKFLPAGGVIWSPDEDTHLFLVFPQPKLSRRLATAGEVQWWGYLAGEFGGGRWSVERASGATDSLDYTDLRVNLGLETVAPKGLKGHVEVGYVFARRVNFTSDTPDFKPQDTLMLRAGVSY